MGKILKFQGEIQEFPGEHVHYFSQKKRQLIMEKIKNVFFSLPAVFFFFSLAAL